jgi:hypothetical protein
MPDRYTKAAENLGTVLMGIMDMAGVKPAARAIRRAEPFADKVGDQLRIPITFRGDRGRLVSPTVSPEVRALPENRAMFDPRAVDTLRSPNVGVSPGQLEIPRMGGALVPQFRETGGALPLTGRPQVQGVAPNFYERMRAGEPLEGYRGTVTSPGGMGAADFGPPQVPGTAVSPAFLRRSQEPQIIGRPGILDPRPEPALRGGPLGRPVNAYEQVGEAGRRYYDPEGSPRIDLEMPPRGGDVMRRPGMADDVRPVDVSVLPREMASAVGRTLDAMPAGGGVNLKALIAAGFGGGLGGGLITRAFNEPGKSTSAIAMPGAGGQGGAETPSVENIVTDPGVIDPAVALAFNNPAFAGAMAQYTDPVSQTRIITPGDGGRSALTEQIQQYAAPGSMKLSDFYGKQQQAGKANIEGVIDQLGVRGTDLEQWARANQGLAFREVVKQQEQAARTDLNARSSFPAPQEIQPMGASQQSPENVVGEMVNTAAGSNLQENMTIQPRAAAQAAFNPEEGTFDLRDVYNPLVQPTLINQNNYEKEAGARSRDLARAFLNRNVSATLEPTGYSLR